MIYVDTYIDAMLPEGWKKRLFQDGGHMFGTDLEELHRMASRIGMKRSWFQSDGTFPHYDLSRSRRLHAIRLGAQPIEPMELPVDILQRDPDNGGWIQRAELLRRRHGG